MKIFLETGSVLPAVVHEAKPLSVPHPPTSSPRHPPAWEGRAHARGGPALQLASQPCPAGQAVPACQKKSPTAAAAAGLAWPLAGCKPALGAGVTWPPSSAAS